MKFKTLEWVRKIRDENYEKCKGLSSKEKIEYTKNMARNLKIKKHKMDSTADNTAQMVNSQT